MEPDANRRLFLNKRKTETLIRMASLGAMEEDLAFLRECLLFTNNTSATTSSATTSPSPLRRNSLVDFAPNVKLQAQLLSSSTAAAANATMTTPVRNKEYNDLMSYFQIEYAPSAKSSRGKQRPAQPQQPEQEEDEASCMNPTRDSWTEFDIFAYAESEGQVLVRMGEALLHRHGFIQEFSLHAATLRSFLTLLDSTYLPVPYHNATHGADVAHVMSYFLLHANLAQRGDALMHFASLIAALGHDVAHPGFSNRFLIHTDDALAITFNDKSPLENMHASTLFQILHTHDILQALGALERRRFRQFVIEMILATDNAVHAEVVARVDVHQPADVHVFQASLHAADLAGGGKTVALSRQWTERLLEEFYAQGDLERELELYEVLPVMDRNSKLHRGVFQEAFIKQICIPLYQTLRDKCGLDLALPLGCFESNAKQWMDDAMEQQQQQEEEEEEEEDAKPPTPPMPAPMPPVPPVAPVSTSRRASVSASPSVAARVAAIQSTLPPSPIVVTRPISAAALPGKKTTPSPPPPPSPARVTKKE